jgi:hypothetical protein
MVSESIISPKKKRVSRGKKSPSDQMEHRKLNSQWKPNQVEEEDFNSRTALMLLQPTKTRTLQVTVTQCSIADCTCTMSDGITPGKKCDGEYACKNANPAHVGCGSCNGSQACREFTGESSLSIVQC